MNNLSSRLAARLLALAAFSLACPSAYPQQANTAPEKPSPPLVTTPPDRAHWKITPNQIKKQMPADAQENPELLEIEAWKTPSVARVIQQWGNGKASESWIADGYLLHKFPALPDIYVTPLSLRSSVQDDGMSDFNAVYPGFTWLDLKYYTGVIPLGGKKCHHYADPENDREAWVDAETKAPVAYRNGASNFVYAFLAPPAQDPTMPEAFLRELQNYKKADSQ
ncbi:MAG: hypothetical protein WC003_04300 [Terrimicrobiaceae bacterium]